MELRIGGNEVNLSLSKTFVAEDEGALLLQISKHKPLADYLTKWKPADGSSLSSMTVVSVDMIASRIASILVEVTLVHAKTKAKLSQRVRLSDEVRSVVLPVAMLAGGKPAAVLIERRRIATGGELQLEAIEGTFGKDGTLTNSVVPAVLKLFDSIGWSITEKTCTALSMDDVSLGADSTPVRLLQATKIFGAESLNEALAASKDGDVRLVAVDLDLVPTTTTDLKACVAASLALDALAKQQHAAQ